MMDKQSSTLLLDMNIWWIFYCVIAHLRFFPHQLTYSTEPGEPAGDIDPTIAANADGYRVDDIKTQYHPNSNIREKVDSFSTYKTTKSSPDAGPKGQPWAPFRSRAEFEFAEIALDAALSNHHVDALIDIIHTLIKGDSAFELKNNNDIRNLWDIASSTITAVCTPP